MRTEENLVMIYIDGEQYFYKPFILPCKCGSNDLDIDEASGSCHSITCNKCERTMHVEQVPSGNPWLKLQERWNDEKRKTLSR